MRTIERPRRPLLFIFREAAEIEHRLLWLEDWLLGERPTQDSLAFTQRWTIAVLRLLQLVRKNPRLEPYHAAIHRHLLALYEGQA
jgi:hypothetical protein